MIGQFVIQTYFGFGGASESAQTCAVGLSEERSERVWLTIRRSQTGMTKKNISAEQVRATLEKLQAKASSLRDAADHLHQKADKTHKAVDLAHQRAIETRKAAQASRLQAADKWHADKSKEGSR